jgi:hypothetical protein
MNENSVRHDMPANYKPVFVLTIRFALMMTCVGLLFGILYRESTRKLIHLGAADHWAATEHLALVHGHSFVIGVFIPMSMLLMIYFAHIFGGGKLKARPLLLHFQMYIIGASGAIALLIYKGYHYVLSFRSGRYDVYQIDQSMFAANDFLRACLYSGAHVLMGIGLFAIALSIWNSLRLCRKE